jgi:magnesium chelatase family protein
MRASELGQSGRLDGARRIHGVDDCQSEGNESGMMGSELARPAQAPRVSAANAPGASKSLLARRLTTILPAQTFPAAVDTTRIPHVVGLTGDGTAWVTTRPFRAPHHTSSDGGLIGGGQMPMPGEVSNLARPTCSG